MRSRTGSEDAVAALIADDLAHLLEDDVFHEDEDGRDLVGEHVGVGRGRQPLAGHRHHVDAVRQLIEEARVGYRQLPKKKQSKSTSKWFRKALTGRPFLFPDRPLAVNVSISFAYRRPWAGIRRV